MSDEASRPILAAELLAVGTELTVGETTDTNSGELARSLVAHGVRVTRIEDLPDDLDVVTSALVAALGRADLVVTTGGLGPTPDDLTREAVAAACGEGVAVDPEILAWLEGLWARRRMPFPSTNVKQAWRIPSSISLPNPNGTAPGWWVDRPDGRVIVTLPGPPREMRPMWADAVLPRLAARGVGTDSEVRTLRLTGIGESQVAERLGEALLRAANPIVATYARQEAVDVRISARGVDGRSAASLADEAEAVVLEAVAEHVWARGETTWAAAIGIALAAHAAPGWTLATSERGLGGALVALLRGLGPVLRLSEVRDAGDRDGSEDRASGGAEGARRTSRDAAAEALADAGRVRMAGGADVGLAIRARAGGDDTTVEVGVVTPEGSRAERRTAFLRGNQGAERAAIAGAAILLEELRPRGSTEPGQGAPRC